MDYSLLVGLHFRQASYGDSVIPRSRSSRGHPPTDCVLLGITLWFYSSDTKPSWKNELILQDMETLLMMELLVFLTQTWSSFFLILPGRSNLWTWCPPLLAF